MIDEYRPAWQEQAACRGASPATFFPSGGRGSTARAKQICAGCPVVEECLAFAVEHRIIDGVFGGLDVRQRRAVQAHNPRRRAVSVCGTESGYQAHRRADPPTPACDACREAWAAAARDRSRAS